MKPRQPRLVSVVAPVHNNAAQLPRLVAEVAASLQPNKVEIVLVDDGSSDDSWAIIRKEKAKNRGRLSVRGIRLSRNFGQHRAICAGLQAAQGDFVFVLDADLQDDPAYMPEMLALALSGHEVVHARRRARIFNPRHLVSQLVYLVVTKVSEIPWHPGMGNYKILSRKALLAALKFQTYHPLLELMVAQAGFRPGFLDVRRRTRPGTASAYGFFASLRFVFGLLVNYSTLFFRAMLITGLIVATAVPLLLLVFAGPEQIERIIAGCAALASGTLLMASGILGYYIRNLQVSSRQWPIFVIDETI
ncbi:MAG: glycosyltransferase family 2 protein [Spirochaetota bacterium]